MFKKTFDNNKIIKDIYKNNLLDKLHSLILSTYEDSSEIYQYNEAFNQLSNLINIQPLTLVEHIKNYNQFPPKILQIIGKNEQNEIINMINNYESKLLNISNIGNLICSILYDDLNNDKPESVNKKEESFKTFLEETIENFDNHIDDNFENYSFYQQNFMFTMKYIGEKLNTYYLERFGNGNYLILVKTDNGIKFILDLTKSDLIYLKNLMYNQKK